VGPAWADMHGLLTEKITELNKTATLIFDLSDKEMEVQAKAAEANAKAAENVKLLEQMAEQQKEATATQRRNEAARVKMQQAHDQEMREAREQQDRKMQKLEEETKKAIANGETALAEQKMESQRRLTESLNVMEQKHTSDMHKMSHEHKASMNAMIASQAQLEGEIGKIRSEAEEQAARHRQELQDIQDKPASGGGVQYIIWPWWG